MKYSKLMLKSFVITVSIALTACNEHRGIYMCMLQTQVAN